MERRKKVRLENIAEKLGVSTVTVSNALKGKKGVSEELKEKIEMLAKEMGYEIVNREKKDRNKSYIIAVLVAERYVTEVPSFYMDIYRHIAGEGAGFNCLTLLEIVLKNEEASYTLPELIKADGVIIIGEINDNIILNLKDKIPLVCLDYYNLLEGVDYIVCDGYKGMEHMTNLLIENGHRDIMFVGTVEAGESITDRYMGYCKAMKKHGIELREEHIINDRETDSKDYSIKISLPDKLPTAFACNCDLSGKVLIKELEKRGFKVPEDISVVGFDNYYSKLGADMQLSTYENDGKMLAKLGVKTLIKNIEKPERKKGIRIISSRPVRGNTVKNINWEVKSGGSKT